MESEYERSKIERTKRDLYNPNSTDVSRIAELPRRNIDTNDTWAEQDAQIANPKEETAWKYVRFTFKFLIAAAIISVCFSVAYLAYSLWKGMENSPENIILIPDIPVAVTSGVGYDIGIRIENKNQDAIRGVVLTIHYPEGTKLPGTEQGISKDTKDIGEIPAGGLATWDGNVAFFGRENAQLEVKFTIKYSFKGINSTFERSVSRIVRVSTAPVSVRVETLGEVNSGQTVEFKITVLSNTTVDLSRLALRAEYPQGFTFLGSEPQASGEKNLWRIDSLKPGERFVVQFRGVATGEEGQKRSFRFVVGPEKQGPFGGMEAEYANILREITLQKSFIGIELFLDDRPAGDSITNFGQRVSGRIFWKNNLATKILDVQIELKLNGPALDRKSVKPDDGGFYRSIDDTIIWEQRNTPDLALVDIGEQGSVFFSFFPLGSVSNGELMRNPTVTMEISVRGKRVLETGVPEEIRTISVRTIKVNSEAKLVSRSIRTIGPIVNRGPIPPKVDQETTYTIVWSIINSSNDIAGAVVRAVVPPNVRYTGTVSPYNENIVFNETTKEVVWTVGNVPAGTGITSKPREVYFQVALIPSITQTGTPAEILYESRFVARDAFTGDQLSQTSGMLSTVAESDPNLAKEDYSVVP